MNTLFFIRTVRLLFILFLFFTFTAKAQTLPPPTTKSPNEGTLEKFTNIPVNLFTGTPDISIPIHTLTYGNIEVPISLRYNAGAVKPAQHPGWVGLGWDLQSFGAITRTIRGQADDPYGDPANQNVAPQYPYPYYPESNVLYWGSDLANASNWDTQQSLYFDMQQAGIIGSPSTYKFGYDVQADEFSFNFMGYSGTFYYSGTTLGWQVNSDQNIQVTFNGLLPANQIPAAIQEFKQFNPSLIPTPVLPNSNYQPNVFSGFTLTVPDGTKYVFGGSEGIEFSSDYANTTGPFSFTANTWLLTKIIDVNNNEVDFTYQRTYPTVSLSFDHEDKSVSISSSGNLNSCSSGTFTYGNVDVRAHSGTLQWPMYLKKIFSPNETITFAISDATCLRYPDTELQQIENGGGNNFNNQNNLFNYSQTLDYNVSNLRWEELDNIVISNSSQNTYRQYHFGYSSSASQRLTLNNFSELDNSSSPNTIEQYQFGYNNIAGLQVLYDGDYTDHWGFYNNVSVSGVYLNNVYNLKQTNPNLVTTGLLNQITYPTGGYTQLTWEAHDYNQVVPITRSAPLTSVGLGYAGGSRLKELKTFDKIGLVVSDKNYYYKRNYTAGANINTLSSSGILNGIPTYTMNISNRQYSNNTFSMQLASLNSLTTYSYNGANSYIGYDDVAEVNADGSYTRYFFTSYGADLNNVSHWDIVPTGYIGWQLGQDAYFPMSSLESERGKPTGIYQYTSNNILIQKINYVYRSDAARFNSYIKLIDNNGGVYRCTSALNPGYDFGNISFASARKQFTYDYYPVSKTVTSYDQNGTNPVTALETYNSYDANNMLTMKTVTNSKAESVVTNYTYTTEATDATSQAMAAAHILTPIIQTSVTNNGPVSLTNTTYYSPYSGYYLPQTVQLQSAANPVETRQQFYHYDTHGNVQEESKTSDVHDVYLWGYNSQYLVATITNSTLTAVQQAMTANNITQAMLDNAATSTDAQMRTLLGVLRTSLPNSQVTIYTYAPVIGMTSVTDPKSETNFYEYDSFQRLMNIKNKDGNIVKHYDYHYQGQ